MEFYDYDECSNYLQDKYKYDERDYIGRYKEWGVDATKPYLDFWHWIIANNEVSNGCFIDFTKGVLDEIQENWVKTIYKYYLDEFAENGKLKMFVSW